jgi:hypothetical protein
VKQRLGLLQIARLKALSEPPVDRSQQVARLLHLALVEPEAGGGAQFPGLGVLLACDTEGALEKEEEKNASVKGGQELIVDLVRIVVRLCLASCRSGHKAFGLFGCEFGGGLMRRIVLAALITSLAVGTAAAQFLRQPSGGARTASSFMALLR